MEFTDTERLEWIITHEAIVAKADYGWWLKYQFKGVVGVGIVAEHSPFPTFRECIDNAMTHHNKRIQNVQQIRSTE